MPFPDLPERLADVRRRLGEAVKIIAVTKTYGPEAVVAAWQAGVTDVGENRVQEAVPKMAAVDVPVHWHLIGHLQRNKVKSVDGFALVHSVDSARLADALHEFGVARRRAVDMLMQVNTSGEASKFGLAPGDVPAEASRLVGLPGVRVLGVMTMAPLEASMDVVRSTFRGARRMLEIVRAAGHPATELSMGMSNDFEIAVEEGATMVRLGTILFGARSK